MDVATSCARPGACLAITYPYYLERRLYPYGGGWRPDPSEISMSLWLKLDPVFFEAGGSFDPAYFELVRMRCSPEPCAVLLELHRLDSSHTPELVLQREEPDDTVLSIPCALPVAPDTGWHRLFARVLLDDAGRPGECELGYDDMTVAMTDVSYVNTSGATVQFSEVLVGGVAFIAAGADRMPSLYIDDVCIGRSAADVACEDGGTPPVDASVPPIDAGTAVVPPPFTLRGSGGCACTMAGKNERPAPMAAVLSFILFACLARRRWSI